MLNIQTNQQVKDLNNLLGKQVSYSFFNGYETFKTIGTVTSIVLNFNRPHEFSVHDEDYFSFEEVTDFKILD